MRHGIVGLVLLGVLGCRGSPAGPAPSGGFVLTIAHRGFSTAAPENTMAAFRLCLDRGIPAVECDVRLSADGVPVLMHDETLRRTAGVAGKVGERTLAELQTLDVGAWKSPAYAGERVPTFAALLKLVNGRMIVFIDMKEDIEAPVIEAVRSSGVPWESVVLCNPRKETLERAARLEPQIPRVWYLRKIPPGDAEQESLLQEALRLRVRGVGYPARDVVPDFVRRARKAGLQFFVWTVNDPGEMRRLIDLGMDGIFTDVPDVLLDLRS